MTLSKDPHNWLEKYRPTSLSDYLGNYDKVSIIKSWIADFKKPTTKKILLLSGPPAIGKTTLAHIILREAGFNVIEQNASDIRGTKSISELLTNVVNFHSVIDLFHQHRKPTALILDEIDTLCQGGSDRGGMSEFIAFIKQHTHTTRKDTTYSIKNPIVCTFNDFSDKKLTDLRKFALEVRLSKPNKQDMRTLAMRIINAEGMQIDEDDVSVIVAAASDDYRQLIHLLYNLYLTYHLTPIKSTDISAFCRHSAHKDIDKQLFDTFNGILNVRQNYSDIIDTTLSDPMMLTFLAHHNYPQFLASRGNGTGCFSKDRARDVSARLCETERIFSFIYDSQQWELLPHTSQPLLYLNSLSDARKLRQNTVAYPTIITKSTTRGKNRKLHIDIVSELNLGLSKDELIQFGELILMLLQRQDYKRIADLCAVYHITPKNLEILLRSSRLFMHSADPTTTDSDIKINAKVVAEILSASVDI
jgi:DNA polymerase III delta prime subunit